MNLGHRICDMDFKPIQRYRSRRRQWWLMGIIAGVTLTAFTALTIADKNEPAKRATANAPHPPRLTDAGGSGRLHSPLPEQSANGVLQRDAASEKTAASPEMAAPAAAMTGSKSLALAEPNLRPQASPGGTRLPPTDAPTMPSGSGQSGGDGASASVPDWKILKVRAGDNLAALFRRASLTPRDVYDVVNASERAGALKQLHPGETLRLRIADDGTLMAVRYALSPTETLRLKKAEDGFSASVEERPLDRRMANASAVIDASLFAAGASAGMSDRLIMELVNIFAWDIDFALDIRSGDAFSLVYEELYRDGKKIRDGRIVAAEFVNRGEHFRAVRYTNPDGRSGYFTPEGENMRKAFLRTPVDFTRVSSNFNPDRLHPILGTRRPHMGTDYATPRGTPIKAAGDGKIIHRGRKGGYGNAVVIRHGGRYTTLYAHMRGFRKGQHVGSRVSQGEVIGYVGTTGLSNGPHLHYEFRVDGVHRNPRTVELPKAKPVADNHIDDFKRETQPLLAELKALTRTRLASAQSE